MIKPNFAHLKIGELLTQSHKIQDKHVKIVLLRQECGDARLFGEIAVALGYVDKSSVEEYVDGAI